MQWSELWDAGKEPSAEQVKEYVDTPLWEELTGYLQQTYHVSPKLFYSGCSMDNGFWKGWNIKYKKSGKALCTLYPKQGYFIALVNVGAKEIAEADLLLPRLDAYTQNLYKAKEFFGTMGKSLPIEVKSEAILRDVKSLIALRVPVHSTLR
ncbi:MAG TPA: hypothetical protein DEB31_00385 [Clostridiales bacterium]|nr:hypothetical protein [Clostridiales bacterium]